MGVSGGRLSPHLPTMDTLRFRLPDGATGFSVGGTEYAPDTHGCIRIPIEHQSEALRHGLVPVGDEEEPTEEEPDDEAEAERESAPRRSHHRKTHA